MPKVVSAELPDELYARLDEFVRRERVSKNLIIRNMIKMYLDKLEDVSPKGES